MYICVYNGGEFGHYQIVYNEKMKVCPYLYSKQNKENKGLQ